MRPFLLATVAFSAASSLSLAAFARPTDCPPGEWFCASETSVAEEGVSEPVVVQPAPVQVEAASRPVVVLPQAQPMAPPPRVVIIIMPGGAPVEAAPPPPPPPRPRVVVPRAAPRKIRVTPARPSVTPSTTKPELPLEEVGFDIHAQRLGFYVDELEGKTPPDARLVGGGAALRIHVDKKREFDFGNDCFFGKDFNGLSRGEVGFTGMVVRHFNPDSKFRFYALGGGSFWFGSVRGDKQSVLTPQKDKVQNDFFATYGAATLQAGLGTEIRLFQSLSFHIDLLGSLRYRFAASGDAPEYINPINGEAVNYFPGLHLRGGVTFWPSQRK